MRRLIPLLFAVLPVMACARVRVLAYGQLAGNGGDKAVATAAPLGNGVPGNRLGGLGSAIDYAGCNIFLALPDRGPNAVAWNSALDNTTSYINRVQTLRMVLHPAPANADFPLQVDASLLKTTLLWSATPLVYGSGKDVDARPGKPALDAERHRYYFTGRSDGYDPAHASNWPADARLDSESLRLAPNGREFYLGDEYGPHLYVFDRATGRRIGVIHLPPGLAVAHPRLTAKAEDRDNRTGRVGNHGLEGLAITPDGHVLYGALQAPLLQDGGDRGGYTRLLRIDLRNGKSLEYAYPLDRVGGTAAKPHYAGISEIIAVNGHELLVDERGGGGLGGDKPARVKRIYKVDLAHARPLGDLSGSAALASRAVHKHLFADLVKLLAAHGMAVDEIPEKFEGLAFGPDVRVDGHVLHTLWISTDNDFLSQVSNRLHPHGQANPDRFLVLGFDDADLPGWVRENRTRCIRQ
jgi:Esterase-like activity of phytase